MIAGPCRAVIVVEAAVTGGALITATLAMGCGITVFAVLGDVDRETSVGCNMPDPRRRPPVFDPEDLVEGLSVILGPPTAVGERTGVGRAQPSKPDSRSRASDEPVPLRTHGWESRSATLGKCAEWYQWIALIETRQTCSVKLAT